MEARDRKDGGGCVSFEAPPITSGMDPVTGDDTGDAKALIQPGINGSFSAVKVRDSMVSFLTFVGLQYICVA